MRARIWIFSAVVALALALNLARLSLGLAQTGEDMMRARLASASTALRGQLDLLDARLAPRAVAMMPELIEAVRGGDGQPAPRPDERALRAAGAVLAPEPDLFAVVNAKGAILSRRARPVQVLDDPAQLPLSETASGALPTPVFKPFDGATYRFAAARVPGATAAAVVGMLIDDRFAAQLKSQVDADVTLLQGTRIIASSLPAGDERARLLRWAASPGPGYGVLQIRLPYIGTELSGKLPQGASQFAVRGALIPLDGGVQAALTVPASPYLAWLGRYQAFYLAGLAILVLFGFVWGLFARPALIVKHVPVQPEPAEQEDDGVVSPPRRAPRSAPILTGSDQPRPAPVRPAEARPAPVVSPPRPAPVVTPARTPAPSKAAELSGLDPDVPVPGDKESAPAWDETTFAPTPGLKVTAGDGADQGVPDWDLPPPPAAASPSPEPHRNGAPGLADSLDPPVPPPAEAAAAAEPFPGDEPTRAEGVSAALIDKLREEEAAPESDPDETHWRETYDQFVELKTQLGEPADRLSFEKFAAKLKKNRSELVAKHNCKGVRFSVYEKDGKAAIKASAIR
jgi:hypothetical protein